MNHSIPWNAWYGDTQLDLDFPENWNVQMVSKRSEKPVAPEIIFEEAGKLAGLVVDQNPRSVCIAIDDLTRPLSYELFLTRLLSELQSRKFKSDITVLIGLGTHRKLSEQEIGKKTGSLSKFYENLKIVNHDHVHETDYAGFDWGKIPVKINKHFLSAEYKIILSTIIPHPFAGFSGGAKMVLPGLSNIEVTKRTHQMALMGFVGKTGKIHGNKFRVILDQLISNIEINYFVGFLSDQQRSCIAVQGGDLNSVYAEMTEKAKQVYSFDIEKKKYDVVWLNAFPKDNELLQIDTAFVPLLAAAEPFWHENSVFVISAACHNGLGHHELFGPGGKLYREPRQKRGYAKDNLVFFIPGLSSEEFSSVYWNEYALYNEFQNVIQHIDRMNLNNQVLVFPAAPIQLVS